MFLFQAQQRRASPHPAAAVSRQSPSFPPVPPSTPSSSSCSSSFNSTSAPLPAPGPSSHHNTLIQQSPQSYPGPPKSCPASPSFELSESSSRRRHRDSGVVKGQSRRAMTPRGEVASTATGAGGGGGRAAGCSAGLPPPSAAGPYSLVSTSPSSPSSISSASSSTSGLPGC